MKKIKINILTLIILLSTALFSQNAVRVSGIIVDKDLQKPLEGANIFLEETTYFTSSDAEGYFQFSRISTGIYTINIQMVGYYHYKQTIKIDEFSERQLFIQLKPELYYLPVQTVEAKKQDMELKEGQIIHTYYIDSLKNLSNNLEAVLKTIPGITVLKNSNGKTKVQTAGAEAKHVKILVDGVDVTNPQTGEVFVEMVAPENISKIEVIDGGASKYGTGAMGSVVNIVTKTLNYNHLSYNSTFAEFEKNRNGNGIKAGKVLKGDIDTYKHTLSAGIKFYNHVYWYNSFSFKSAQNKYVYPYDGEDWQRSNNHFIQRRLFSKISLSDSIRYLKRLVFQLTYNYDYNRMPGNFYHLLPLLNAYAKEKCFLANSNAELELPYDITFQTTNSYKKFDHFLNGENEPFDFIKFKSKNINDVWETNNSFSTSFWQNRYFVELGFNYQKEKLHMKDLQRPENSMGNHQRQMYALTFQNSIKYQIKNWGLNLSYLQRMDKYHHDKWKGFPSVSGGIKNIYQHFVFRVFGQYGRGFKYPDLNSYFWVPNIKASGNPNLKPERSKNKKAGAAIDIVPLKGHIQAAYYHNQVFDYILWLEGQGGWKPVNLSETKISGYEFSAGFEPFSFLKIQADYYHQKPLNKSNDKTQVNSYNKQLPFIFSSQLKGNAQIAYQHFYATVFYQNNSSRKSNAYNTDKNELPGFIVWDVHLGRNINLKKIKLNLSLEVDNFFNKAYVLLNGYPMPGRNYKINIQISSNNKSRRE